VNTKKEKGGSNIAVEILYAEGAPSLGKEKQKRGAK